MKDKSSTKLDIGLSARAELKVDITEPINALTVNPATVLGEYFSAKLYKKYGDEILEQKIRQIEHKWAREKLEYIRETEHLAMTSIYKIDESNLKDPSPSDLIPPIIALDIFYDKDHYRKMLARLISSTFNQDAINHPSFVEIIKQLSNCDVNVLIDVFALGQTLDITVAKPVLVPRKNVTPSHESTEILILKYHDFGSYKPKSLKFKENEISNAIFNLTNLGILTFDSKFSHSKPLIFRGKPEEVILNDEFLFFRESETYKDFLSIYNKDYKIGVLYVSLYFTSLGRDFFEVCIAGESFD